ncbi:MAG: glycosyltransferase family 4 protein [bacterium]|nr:glycosyltransferase family 4 protein [bacterium]
MTKLLMITRKIDKSDWLAGHSYEWAKKISGHLRARGGRLIVICLERGNTDGLEDTPVYTLGKENGVGRTRRFFRFLALAKKLVPQIDGVFCHQNPEYAIAIAPLAKFYRKKIVSWYVHKSVTWKTRLMLAVSDKVLTASSESFRLKSKKVFVVGHGIDLDKFQITNSKLPASPAGRQISEPAKIFRIITIGRISPVKSLETIIEAVRIVVREQGFSDVQLDIVGQAAVARDRDYLAALKRQVLVSDLGSQVHFVPAVPHDRIAEVYGNAEAFVNLSQTGSVDKAVLEAMACGCMVITSNEAFFEMLQGCSRICLIGRNSRELAERILWLKKLVPSDRAAIAEKLRAIVVNYHSLDNLAATIVASFE